MDTSCLMQLRSKGNKSESSTIVRTLSTVLTHIANNKSSSPVNYYFIIIHHHDINRRVIVVTSCSNDSNPAMLLKSVYTTTSVASSNTAIAVKLVLCFVLCISTDWPGLNNSSSPSLTFTD